MDSSAADSLSQTVQLFQNLDMRYQVNVAGVKEQDLITQDLLHRLELESLDAVENGQTGQAAQGVPRHSPYDEG